MTIDDDTLMRYADGELSPAEARRVDEALKDDSDLRSRLAVFTSTASMVRSAFPIDEDEPIDPRLIAAITAPPRQRRLWQVGVPAMAASLALVVGLGVGSELLNNSGGSGGLPSLDGEAGFQQAMETQRSGATLVTASGDVTPVLTFQDENGQYCREYQATIDGGVMLGIACRDGGWTTDTVHYVEIAETSGTADFRPVEGARAAFDAMVRQRVTDPPLLDQEQAVIDAGWPDVVEP